MANASKAFLEAHRKGSGERHESLRSCIPTQTIHAGVAAMCNAIVELQEARRLADYDLSRDVRRHDALALVQLAEAAIARWRAASTDPSAQAYRISPMLCRTVRRD